MQWAGYLFIHIYLFDIGHMKAVCQAKPECFAQEVQMIISPPPQTVFSLEIPHISSGSGSVNGSSVFLGETAILLMFLSRKLSAGDRYTVKKIQARGWRGAQAWERRVLGRQTFRPLCYCRCLASLSVCFCLSVFQVANCSDLSHLLRAGEVSEGVILRIVLSLTLTS